MEFAVVMMGVKVSKEEVADLARKGGAFDFVGAGIGMAIFTLLVGMDPAGGMRTCMIVALVAWIVLFLITFLLKKPEADQMED